MVVSIYGIFVIETKNYKGWIHGNESSELWTQTIYNDKYKFPNPIKQNYSHIYALKKVFLDYKDLNYYQIVVFAGTAELKNVNTKAPVVYRSQLLNVISDESKEKNISFEDLSRIVEILNFMKENNRDYKKEHIANIKRTKL